MKFGKRLKKQIQESLPSWRDKFLAYKDLKQCIIVPSDDAAGRPSDAAFLSLLYAEIDKLNSFFLEQEELFIIRLKELQDRINRVGVFSGDGGDQAAVAKIRLDIVNLHGEMVLLLNYSSINYIALAKILKKYDKRTGGVLRLPVIDQVLKQPFFATDLITKLVKECEAMMAAVFPATVEDQLPPDRPEPAAAEQSIFRNTVAALLTLRDVRSGSSTVGQFSLPPLSLPDSEWLLPPPSPIPTQ